MRNRRAIGSALAKAYLVAANGALFVVVLSILTVRQDVSTSGMYRSWCSAKLISDIAVIDAEEGRVRVSSASGIYGRPKSILLPSMDNSDVPQWQHEFSLQQGERFRGVALGNPRLSEEYQYVKKTPEGVVLSYRLTELLPASGLFGGGDCTYTDAGLVYLPFVAEEDCHR